MSTDSPQLAGSDFFEEFQKEFLDEASYLLELCEESYLNLERPENRRDELSKIFRLAHSIKATGAAVGFLDISRFTHSIEDCVTILRANPDLVNSEIISLFLRIGDALKYRIKMLKEKSTEAWDVTELENEIKAIAAELAQDHTQTQIHPVKSNQVTQVLHPVNGSSPIMPKPSEGKELPKEKKPNGQNTKSQQTSVKVDTERIDSVLDMVGELVVLKSQLKNEANGSHSTPKMNDLVSLLDKSIRELQDKALGMRMTPLKTLFLKTQRVVRDLSVKLNKPMEFVMTGEETELDRNMVELLGDPLMHIVRNALDHGIEPVDKRKTLGKSEKGTLTLQAQQVGGRVIVKVIDDGGGISRENIIKKAKEVGLTSGGKTPDAMSEQEVLQLIFAPGFSTATCVSDVSGRGVGLDVVKTNIDQLKGNIEIKTEMGKGTSFIISVPLTTSISDGMQVTCEGQAFILPLDRIRELMDIKNETTTKLDEGQEVLNIRGKILPVLNLAKSLKKILDYTRTSQEKQNNNSEISNTIVVVESSTNGLVAIRVQAVVGQVQVVLKPLGEYFLACKEVAGAAILGDGKVALVLDIDNLKTGESQAA
ncbi:MAG: chemotaxis protein CheA [Bdellovibrionota bacterium]